MRIRPPPERPCPHDSGASLTMRAWKTLPLFAVAAVVAALLLQSAPAQQDKKDDKDKKQADKKQADKKEPDKKDGPFGKFGGGFGGPPMGEVRKVLAKYDKDKNGRLDAAERKAARAELEKDRKGGFGKGGPKG